MATLPDPEGNGRRKTGWMLVSQGDVDQVGPGTDELVAYLERHGMKDILKSSTYSSTRSGLSLHIQSLRSSRISLRNSLVISPISCFYLHSYVLPLVRHLLLPNFGIYPHVLTL
jgi:hypothetical protein